MTLKSRLDAQFDRALAEKRIVGGVVLAAKNGTIVYQRAAGFADRANGRETRTDTIFRLASLTKPLVATTVLAMCDAGRISTGTPVREVVPWFTPSLPDGTRPAITIHHLLTHTAGLTADITPTKAEIDADPDLAAESGNHWHLPLEATMRRLAGRQLNYTPGEGWAYGQALDVLGYVAAVLNNSTLEQAVAKYVTGPLGMHDTAFHVTDPERLSVAYADAKPEPVEMSDPHAIPNKHGTVTNFASQRINDQRAYQSGGGGMAGTAPDFFKWMLAVSGYGEQILTPGTLAAATRNQIGDVPRGPLDAGRRFGYFGAVIDDPGAARTPQNPGTFTWGGIFGGSWFVDPVEDLCVLSLTNTGLEGSDGAFPDEIRNAAYGI